MMYSISEESDADVEDNVEQDSSTLVNGKEVGESGYSTDKHNTGESDGTSPSIVATIGDEHKGEVLPGPSPGVSPIIAVSPALSASPTASSSASPSAPASPTASASPCLPESPTAPVSSGGPTSPTPRPNTSLLSQATMTALPVSDWSNYHTPGHTCENKVFDYNCNASGEMRCFTPIDEELRITIPENGEGSIHISPVNPSERPVSRCGFFSGDYHPSTREHTGEPLKDFAPDLETKLLSLYLGDNRRTSLENIDSVNNSSGYDICNIAEICEGIEPSGSSEDIHDNNNDVCDLNKKRHLFQDHEKYNGNNNQTGNSNYQISSCLTEKEALAIQENTSDFKENSPRGCSVIEQVTDLKDASAIENQKSGSEFTLKTQDVNGNKDDVSGWCKTLAPRHSSEEGECSVISCLNQFTSLELMMGNNKVGCDACTKRQNKGNSHKYK